MIDTKLFRESPEALRQAISRKKFTCNWDSLLGLETQRRQQLLKTEQIRALQNKANQEVALLQKGSAEWSQKLQELKSLAQSVKEAEQALRSIETEWEEAVLSVPNLPDASVPDGKTEADNQVHVQWGDPETVSSYAKPHYEIEGFQRWINFAEGSKVTGAGFPFYLGDMARLVRAMVAFFLDEARAHGFTEMHVPFVVNAQSAQATGQLPDKEGQMYGTTHEPFYLIPTAEVPVTNFYRDQVLLEAQLPLYHCAYSPCFRREAGSWGAHVRGLNRLHQFDKVEWVKWVHPDTSFQELESLHQAVQGILQKLELPYRLLLMCAGDIGFAHAKQYDLEVWCGGQKRWMEVSSCSNFTDFQARRAQIRYKRQADGQLAYVHTLNGSGLAIPRTLAALLENNLQADGRIRIPAVLHPYCGFTHLAKPSA